MFPELCHFCNFCHNVCLTLNFTLRICIYHTYVKNWYQCVTFCKCDHTHGKFRLFCLFVWVEALRPSQQFFSHVGTEPPLPGYYQYFWGGKCILLKDTTRPTRVRIEPPNSRSRVRCYKTSHQPLGHRASLRLFCWGEMRAQFSLLNHF